MPSHRLIDESTLLEKGDERFFQRFFEEIVGETPAPWLTAEFSFKRDEEKMGASGFVEIRYDDRLVEGAHVRGCRLSTTFHLSDAMMRVRGVSRHTLLLESIASAFHLIAPALYELDPRIKWYPKEQNPRLPASFLFDPPGPFIKHWGKLFEGHEAWWLHEQELNQCSFCRALVSANPVWGGGNLLWVHRGCWEEVVGGSTRPFPI